MKEFGYHRLTVWFDANEWAMLVDMARQDGRKVTTWVRLIVPLIAAQRAAHYSAESRKERSRDAD